MTSPHAGGLLPLTTGQKISLRLRGNSNSLRHGHTSRTTDGKATPTYQSWQAMLVRCRSTNRDNSDRYAGIVVCARWLNSFENFLADMGDRPAGTTLDRFPNRSGNYSPDNCRWATPRDQSRNTRKNVLDFDKAVRVAIRRLSGETCKSIAADFGISESLPREIVKGRAWPDALESAKLLLVSK